MVPVQDCPSLFTWKIPPVKQGSFHPGPAVPRRQCYQCQDGSAISATSLRTVVPTFCFKRLAPGFRQKTFDCFIICFGYFSIFLTPTSLCMSPALVVWTDTNCNFFRFLKIGWRKRNRREENSASLENVFVQKKILGQKNFKSGFLFLLSNSDFGRNFWFRREVEWLNIHRRTSQLRPRQVCFASNSAY